MAAGAAANAAIRRPAATRRIKRGPGMCNRSRRPEAIVTASAATARVNHAQQIQPMRLTSHTSTDPVISGVVSRCRR